MGGACGQKSHKLQEGRRQQCALTLWFVGRFGRPPWTVVTCTGHCQPSLAEALKSFSRVQTTEGANKLARFANYLGLVAILVALVH